MLKWRSVGEFGNWNLWHSLNFQTFGESPTEVQYISVGAQETTASRSTKKIERRLIIHFLLCCLTLLFQYEHDQLIRPCCFSSVMSKWIWAIQSVIWRNWHLLQSKYGLGGEYASQLIYKTLPKKTSQHQQWQSGWHFVFYFPKNYVPCLLYTL